MSRTELCCTIDSCGYPSEACVAEFVQTPACSSGRRSRKSTLYVLITGIYNQYITTLKGLKLYNIPHLIRSETFLTIHAAGDVISGSIPPSGAAQLYHGVTISYF